MQYTIPEMLASRKVQDMGLILAIILLGVLSFGLGRLSALSVSHIPVTLCQSPQTTPQAAAVGTLDTPSTSQPNGSYQGTYVASKSGNAYHYPWCSGAQRIKDENKVWFRTKEEAEAAGYQPASNCKGL